MDATSVVCSEQDGITVSPKGQLEEWAAGVLAGRDQATWMQVWLRILETFGSLK